MTWLYSDTPIHQNISESLYRHLPACQGFHLRVPVGPGAHHERFPGHLRELFAEFWGQRLVNVMRALHDVKYRQLAHGRPGRFGTLRRQLHRRRTPTKALTWATTNNPKPVN